MVVGLWTQARLPDAQGGDVRPSPFQPPQFSGGGGIASLQKEAKVASIENSRIPAYVPKIPTQITSVGPAQGYASFCFEPEIKCRGGHRHVELKWVEGDDGSRQGTQLYRGMHRKTDSALTVPLPQPDSKLNS